MDLIKNKINNKYIPEIDSLRALAILSVIIYHFKKDILPSGYLGVDIFLVISGYVVTNSLKNRTEKDFFSFFIGFISRRFKRLAPALIFYVVFITLLICLINPIPMNHINTGISSLLGSSNIILFIRSRDYFALEQSLNPFLHTWSLGLEQQFYIFFPILIWFSGFYRNEKFKILFSLSSFSILSFFCQIYFYISNPIGAYYLLPSRFWEFGAGAILAILDINKISFFHKFSKVPSIFPFSFLVLSFFISEEYFIFPKVFAVICCCILIKSFQKRSLFYQFFINSKFRYIGSLSYSLYL